MRPTSPRPFVLLAGVLLLATGCLYRMPIQQGNVLNPDQVAQLETGMTRSQVRFLLGTPMVPNGFDTDRWDYYYFVKWGRDKLVYSKRLTVYFKDDKVERIEQSEDTGTAPPDAPIPATAPESAPAADGAAAPATAADAPAAAADATPPATDAR